jgi:hypothetical protein
VAGIEGEIRAELARLNVSGWRSEVALALAAALDEEPNASMAKELRSLMVDLGSAASAAKKGSTGDELAKQRAARIAKATGS